MKHCTNLGSLIGNFDCGYTTAWEFSNFPATTFIFYVKSVFADLRRSKTAVLNILKALNLDSCKCQKFPKIQNSNAQKCSFMGLQNSQN